MSVLINGSVGHLNLQGRNDHSWALTPGLKIQAMISNGLYCQMSVEYHHRQPFHNSGQFCPAQFINVCRLTIFISKLPSYESCQLRKLSLFSIRNPKSKTVLIFFFFFFFFFFFYSQKTINTLVKSQYISIHLVSFSRVK